MSRRIRSLKPELIEDEKVAPLTDSAFRLFVSMITLADDHGNVRGDIRWLQGQVWWAHAEPPNVLAVLVELDRAHLITAYGVRGGTYIHLNGWEKHQRIDNAGKNRIPMHNDAERQAIDFSTEGDWKLSPKISANLREPGGSPTGFAAGSGSGSGRGEEGEVDSARRAAKPAPKSGEVKKHKLPDGWLPDRSEANTEAERVAAARGVDVEAQLQNLRDWAAANNAKKADWNATWRNWTRNAKPSRPQAQTGMDAVLRIANGGDS